MRVLYSPLTEAFNRYMLRNANLLKTTKTLFYQSDIISDPAEYIKFKITCHFSTNVTKKYKSTCLDNGKESY